MTPSQRLVRIRYGHYIRVGFFALVLAVGLYFKEEIDEKIDEVLREMVMKSPRR